MTEQPDERLGLPSASNWARYERCAGSWALEQEAKRLGQAAHERSVDATRGELIHAYLAGQPDEDGNEIKLSESEQTTADFLQERAQGEVVRIFGDEPVQQLDEKRLWFTLNGKRALSGRFDRVVYTPTKALCQDFKTGFSEPDPAEQNAQLKVLAVLVGLHLPAIEEVYVQVVSGAYGISEAHYSVSELGRAYHEIMVTLRTIQKPDARLSPSLEACRYCGAVNICPAVKQLAQPITKLEISALPDGSAATELLDKVKILEGMFAEIKKYYADRIVSDPAYSVPYYGMVPGNKVRKVSNWEIARPRLAEYLDGETLNKAVDYSISQLESALAKTLKINKAQAKAKFNEILSGLIEEVENKPSLKRIGHKAELAWKPSS